MGKMTRHDIREAAFLLLFEMELSKSTIEETVETTVEAFGLDMENSVEALVSGVKESEEELDEVIGKYSRTRAVGRISKVNLIIMRIAVFEILKRPDVPNKVAINEAIELSKEYADANDTSFISGILGAYFKDIPSDE